MRGRWTFTGDIGVRLTTESNALEVGNPVLRSAVRALVDYMLFVDEAPLPDAIVGNAGFEAVFERRGPFDRRGR